MEIRALKRPVRTIVLVIPDDFFHVQMFPLSAVSGTKTPPRTDLKLPPFILNLADIVSP